MMAKRGGKKGGKKCLVVLGVLFCAAVAVAARYEQLSVTELTAESKVILASGATLQDASGNTLVNGSGTVTADTISEKTAAAGVTVDSVLLKDGDATVDTLTVSETANVTNKLVAGQGTYTETVPAGLTKGIFKNSTNANDDVAVAIVSGTSGAAAILLGDSVNENECTIQWANDTSTFDIWVGASNNGLSLQSDGEVTARTKVDSVGGYKYNGVAGWTGTVTNHCIGFTNLVMYAGGIVTNVTVL